MAEMIWTRVEVERVQTATQISLPSVKAALATPSGSALWTILLQKLSSADTLLFAGLAKSCSHFLIILCMCVCVRVDVWPWFFQLAVSLACILLSDSS